jgi:hypothetical protein
MPRHRAGRNDTGQLTDIVRGALGGEIHQERFLEQLPSRDDPSPPKTSFDGTQHPLLKTASALRVALNVQQAARNIRVLEREADGTHILVLANSPFTPCGFAGCGGIGRAIAREGYSAVGAARADGAAEDDNDGWQQQRESCDRIQIIGDDRYATQNDRLLNGVANSEANCILIKPNQAGTLHSALTALTTAKGSNWGTVASARSGDTEENWLVDLAVGSNAGQIKVGSTHRSERSAKWNRLLELSHFATAPYIGKAALSHVKNLNI